MSTDSAFCWPCHSILLLQGQRSLWHTALCLGHCPPFPNSWLPVAHTVVWTSGGLPWIVGLGLLYVAPHSLFCEGTPTKEIWALVSQAFSLYHSPFISREHRDSRDLGEQGWGKGGEAVWDGGHAYARFVPGITACSNTRTCLLSLPYFARYLLLS